MRLSFIFAMEEEADILKSISIEPVWKDNLGFQLCEFDYNNHKCMAIISGIGKSFSAAATILAIKLHNPDLIINIGLAGGIRCNVGDIIFSQKAIHHDADLTVFGYNKHQMPGLPVSISSNTDIMKQYESIITNIPNIYTGAVLSGDQFISNREYVQQLTVIYPEAKSIDMEAASIASVCYKAKKSFLFIKKISDLADADATDSFKSEVNKISDKLKIILSEILK